MDRRVGKHHRSPVFILQSVEQNVRFFFPPSTHEKWSCCKTNCTGFSAWAKLDWHNGGGGGGGDVPRHAPHTHSLAHSSQVGGDSGDVVRHKSSSPARLSLDSNQAKIMTDMEICVIALGFRCDKYSQCNAQSHEGMPPYWDFYTHITQVYHVI